MLALTIFEGLALAKEDSEERKSTNSPIPVTTKKLADIIFFPLRDAPATAISLNDTRVSSEISGILENIRVRVGDSVKKGDLIASIGCQDYTIAVKEADAASRAGQAQRKFNQSQLNKAKQLSEKGSISSEELDRRVSNATASAAEVERLRAVVDRAKRSVEKCSIHAPFEAVVIERLSSLGDYLVQGSHVLRLLDKENIEISAKVQEQDLETLKAGEDLQFVVRNKEYPLRLRAMLPIMESRIRSYEVRLEFTAENAPPGSAGRVRWKIPQGHIPADLLVRRGQLGIFLEKNGNAEFLQLDQAKEGQPAAVDIPESSNIIIDGRFGIKIGDAVRIVEL